MNFFEELKRRNVFKVGIVYAVTTWILLQLTDVVSDILELPVWAPKLILLILLIGFVPALILAWAFELTPEGLKLEPLEALATPGAADGEIKVVGEGGGAVAYGWSAANGTWDKIGDVLGGPGENVSVGRRTFEGQEYDFVFDVDVEDGAPPLQLPYNRGDNVYAAAERFIERRHAGAILTGHIALEEHHPFCLLDGRVEAALQRLQPLAEEGHVAFLIVGLALFIRLLALKRQTVEPPRR